MYIIYALVDPVTNELKYIGQTDRFIFTRLNEHLKAEANKYDSNKYDWIKSLEAKGMEPDIVVLHRVKCKASANVYERLFIFYWKYILLQPLFNVAIAKGHNLFSLFDCYKDYIDTLQAIDKYQKGYNTKFGNLKAMVR